MTDDKLRAALRAAITNAYYDARNAGETMETAADKAMGGVLAALAASRSRPMTDDRYRINQTSTAILASFHEVAEDYGLRLAGDEQVAICRRLADRLKARSGPLSRSDVLEAFEAIGVRRPPNGFWRDLRDRLERVVG